MGDRGKGGLASFGTYTLKMTLVVGGVTSVRQSTFKVADPRLAEALAWMSSRNGDTVVTHPGKDPLTVNDFCEEVNEWAYGWFSGTFKNIGYPNAAADYQAQLAAGRIHTGTDAPAGALVFFTGADPKYGHVGIAVGDGKHYWTTDISIHEAPPSPRVTGTWAGRWRHSAGPAEPYSVDCGHRFGQIQVHI